MGQTEINPKSALIVYCSKSGPRKTKANLAAVRGPLEKLLAEHKIESRLESDLWPYDAVKEYGKDKKYLFLLTGESANQFSCQAMMEQGHYGQIVGLFPFGSGNDFLKALNIRTNDQALEAVSSHLATGGGTKRVDILCAQTDDNNNPYFGTNMIGIGFNSAISKAITYDMKKKMHGSVAYFLAMLKALVTDFKHTNMRILENGKPIVDGDVLSAMFCNGEFAGGGMRVVPGAEIDDGKIDMFAVDYMNPIKLGLMFSKVYSGSHVKLKECHFAKNKGFYFLSEEALPMQVDGEVIGDVKEVAVTILPKEMEFIYRPK